MSISCCLGTGDGFSLAGACMAGGATRRRSGEAEAAPTATGAESGRVTPVIAEVAGRATWQRSAEAGVAHAAASSSGSRRGRRADGVDAAEGACDERREGVMSTIKCAKSRGRPLFWDYPRVPEIEEGGYFSIGDD